MAKKLTISNTRLKIDKNNAKMVLVIAVAVFITVFSLVASKALLGRQAYQSRAINEKKKALSKIKANNQSAAKLVSAYKVFVSSPDNKIGGTTSGGGDRDGDNAKIVLDALPSKYDFPALATSLDKILSNKSFQILSLSGTDDELKQQAALPSSPVEIPFQISAKGDFTSIQDLIDIFERSIRPIKISKLNFTGNDSSLNISVDAKTYYQPEKKVTVTTKVVK